MSLTKESALVELQKSIDYISELQNERRFSAAHTRWLANTLRVLEEVFGTSSRYFVSLKALTWSQNGSFSIGGPADREGAFNPMLAIEKKHQQAYINQLDSAKGFLLAALDQLESSSIDEVYEGRDIPKESSIILKVINLAEFKLRKIIRIIPTLEKEIQDAFENLLIASDIDYSRETDSIEYSSKTYIPDFSVKKLGLAIEIKICTRSSREKEIIAEINDDILAYKSKYENIFFVIYDTGFIRDIERFTKQFEDQDGIYIKVVKH
jgi:hypothetical protein